MPFDYADLRQKLVNHLIWLETLDVDYAKWALDQARREPSGLYRDILRDVKAEKVRRADALEAQSSLPPPSLTTEPQTRDAN